MPSNRDLFVRAERPDDRTQVTTTLKHALASGWKVVNRPALDKHDRPLPPKPHQELGTPTKSRRKPRTATGAVQPKPEAPVSADTEETE